MRDDQLKAAPFNLNAEQVAWVHASFARLTADEKIAQLFTVNSAHFEPPEVLKALMAFKPGGVTRRQGPDLNVERDVLAQFDAQAPVPLSSQGTSKAAA